MIFVDCMSLTIESLKLIFGILNHLKIKPSLWW